MNYINIKNLVEKGVKGSAEKQLKVFMKNKKTTSCFQKAVNGGDK